MHRRHSRPGVHFPRRSRSEKRMPLPPNTPQDTQAAIVVLVAIAAACSVIYWRAALKVILIAVLILIVYGVVMGFHGASALLATHHH